MRRRGQVLILYTLAVPVIFGALGLAVDVGFAQFRRHAAQTAAQAAVIAAVKHAGQVTHSTFACQAGVPCGISLQCPASVANPPGDSLQAGCLYAQRNGFTSAPGRTVTISSGANGAPLAVPGVNATYWVTAVVSDTVPQTFSAIFGKTETTVTARASAAGFAAAEGGGCIHVLGSTGTGISAVGNASLVTGCGVQVNSTSQASVALEGNAFIRTDGEARTRLAGNWTHGSNATITPAPVLGAPVVPDPFAGLQAPDSGACTSNGVSINGGQTDLDPGVYCGPISLSGQCSARLRPGMYILRNGLALSGGSSLTMLGTASNGWDGVTFYLQGGSINVSGGANIDLRAPTSGSWQGILIFQARGNTTPASLSGGSSQNLNGALYFPDASLSFVGGSSSEGATATILAQSITIAGNAWIAQPATTQFTGGSGRIALLE